MKDIRDYTLKELQALMHQRGASPYRAEQVFRALYQRRIRRFEEMKELPRQLRLDLKKECSFTPLVPVTRAYSADKTEKFLLRLHDGNVIEAVSIPAPRRVTGCVSTQAGCAFACSFCASGKAGLVRNLTPAEIIAQALYLRDESETRRLTHLVFMGTGEPLDNYDNLLAAIRIMNTACGMHIGARRMTISTCGIVKGIERLAKERLQVELSVSLHAADDRTRSRLMPVNRRYPLRRLMQACRSYAAETGRQVTFEYVLIEGVNADLRSAGRLAVMLRGMDAKVNLIPCNPVQEFPHKPPTHDKMQKFQKRLRALRVHSTLRTPRGRDIAAACGQLRHNS